MDSKDTLSALKTPEYWYTHYSVNRFYPGVALSLKYQKEKIMAKIQKDLSSQPQSMIFDLIIFRESNQGWNKLGFSVDSFYNTLVNTTYRYT